MFDLGLEPKFYSDSKEVMRYIQELDQQLDLVLILEYFDESLVLMKRLLCWDLEDLVYIKQKVRRESFRNTVSKSQEVSSVNFLFIKTPNIITSVH